jgi:3-phenylpropionate/cinnamic acid dioxygenase small subunit
MAANLQKDATMGLEDQLQRVADDLEVRDAVARIAQLSDEGALEEYIALFTEDAVWDGGAAFGVRKGHADILAGARERRGAGTSGPGSHNRHVITTSAVQVQGDSAQVRSYFLFYVECDKSPAVRVVGVYQDEFRRTPAGWKLARRMIERA